MNIKSTLSNNGHSVLGSSVVSVRFYTGGVEFTLEKDDVRTGVHIESSNVDWDGTTHPGFN